MEDFVITSNFIIRLIKAVHMPHKFTLIFVKTKTLSRYTISNLLDENCDYFNGKIPALLNKESNPVLRT